MNKFNSYKHNCLKNLTNINNYKKNLIMNLKNSRMILDLN